MGFAARFGFHIESELESAMKCTEALDKKVSKERVGSELENMIKGPDPGRAIGLLKSHRILSVMLGVSKLGNYTNIDQMTYEGAANVESLQSTLKMLDKTFNISVQCKKVCYLAALLIGFRNHEYVGAKGKTNPLCQGILLENLKLSRRDADSVTAIHDNLPTMHSLLVRLTHISSIRTCEGTSTLLEGETRTKVGSLIRTLK